jgi:hypothetical protein
VKILVLISILLLSTIAVYAVPPTIQEKPSGAIICWTERFTDHRAGTPTYLIREVYPHSREPSPYSGFLYSEHSFRYEQDGKLDYRSLVIYVDDKLSSETKWWLIGLGQIPAIGSSLILPTFDDTGRLIILLEKDTTAWPDDRGGILSWTFFDYSSTRSYEHKFTSEGYSQGAVISDVDTDKRVTRRRAFSSVGKLTEDVRYTYDSRGWVATETRGSEKITLQYVVDARGNWTRCDAVTEPIPIPAEARNGGSSNFTPVWTIERTIVYDEPPMPVGNEVRPVENLPAVRVTDQGAEYAEPP